MQAKIFRGKKALLALRHIQYSRVSSSVAGGPAGIQARLQTQMLKDDRKQRDAVVPEFTCGCLRSSIISAPFAGYLKTLIMLRLYVV
jgi:hypothetical protein